MKHGLIFLVFVPLLAAAQGDAADPQRPNVILFLIDDMGWTDLGCFGSDLYQTPQIDRLAAGGIRFTQAYSACTVCSPTRAAVLTGKYPARLHLTDWIPGHVSPKAKLQIPDWTMQLEHSETTVAEALQKAGYATASIGKWHLCNPRHPGDHLPKSHGFDVNIGGTQWGQPGSYFFPYGKGKRGVEPLPPGGKPGEYLADRLTDEALAFIDAHREEPFFIYFPHYNVHTPLQGKPEYVESYKKRARPGLRHQNATYAAMVQSVDDSVGRVLAHLEKLGIRERTLIIFTSDNGGLRPEATSNAPLRAGKGSAYEGGVRVPLIIDWPAVAKPGSECRDPVMSIDFLPTILEAAGAKQETAVDGVSLMTLLRDPTDKLSREALYWHYPHYHPGGATPYGAIRQGDFRLVEFYEDMHVELYNLRDDIGEQHDLAATMPERAAQLRDHLHAWRAKVGAQMPTASSK